MIENQRGFRLHPSGQAVENIVQSDRIERRNAQVNRIEQVLLENLGTIFADSLLDEIETIPIDVEDCNARLSFWKTVLQEVATADSRLEVIVAHVLSIKIEEKRSRAFPDPGIAETKNPPVIERQAATRVARVASLDFSLQGTHRISNSIGYSS